MRKIRIKIINKSGFDLPEYKTEQSAGCDLVAPIDAPIKLYPLDRVFINTKVSVALTDGYEAQVRGRSGLNKYHGIVCPVGTIDADYRGEVGVTLYNLSREPYEIKPGDRIAQLVISPCIRANWEEVEILNTTGRYGGFGSTGK